MNEEIVVSMGLDNTAFARGLRSAKQYLSEFKSSAIESMKDFGKDLFGPLAAFGTFEGVKKILEFGESIKRSSEIAAVSTDFFQTLGYAMSQTGGGADAAARALEKLDVHIGEARAGNKDAARVFADLGISLEETNGNGKSTEQIFREIADRIHDAEEGAGRARIAFEIFGKSGQELIPILAGGSKGLDEFSAKATKLTNDQLENISLLKRSVTGLGNQLMYVAGSIISGWQDIFTLLHGVYVGTTNMNYLGMKGIDAVFTARQRSRDDAARNMLSGMASGESTATINELYQKIDAAKSKTDYDAMDRQGQLNTLLKRHHDLQREIEETKAGSIENLTKQLTLETLADEIGRKQLEVEQDKTRELEKRLRISKEINDTYEALNKASDAEIRAGRNLQEAKDSPNQYSIGELANSRFNFGGTLGSDQSIAREIVQYQRYASFNKEHGDLDRLRFDNSHIDDLKKSLSSENVLPSEREPYRNLEEHARETAQHLRELIEQSKSRGVGVRPIAP